jgi:hypothetical protein
MPMRNDYCTEAPRNNRIHASNREMTAEKARVIFRTLRVGLKKRCLFESGVSGGVRVVVSMPAKEWETMESHGAVILNACGWGGIHDDAVGPRSPVCSFGRRLDCGLGDSIQNWRADGFGGVSRQIL